VPLRAEREHYWRSGDSRPLFIDKNMPVTKSKTQKTATKTKAVKKEPAGLELPVYDTEGKEVSVLKLEPGIFGLKPNYDLMHQVVVSQMANRRKTIAHTKDRGEVRGGGRKPWRQKGTGRARHGSIRSPLWRGGGVTFGPRKEKVFKKEIPKKMKRLALLMVLSAKAKNNLVILIDELKMEKPKTKIMAQIIKNLKGKIENLKEGSILLVLPGMDKNLILAARNIQGLETMQAREINALDLLSSKYLLMPKESVKMIKETFKK
jgi:large subunit ribosomal protein L4